MKPGEGCNASVADDEQPELGGGSEFAGAFYSNDFAWETLRAEVEDWTAEECLFGTSKSIVSNPDGQCVPQIERWDTVGSVARPRTTPVVASSAWEAFHETHSKGLFFKERRYLVKEFPELLSADSTQILEVGCGTGSSVIPILRGNKHATVYGCDCSIAALERATDVVTCQAGLSESRIRSFRPFLCDISSEDIPSWLCCSSCRSLSKRASEGNEFREGEHHSGERMECTAGAAQRVASQVFGPPALEQCCLGGVSIVTLIFTLSSIPLDIMNRVLGEIEAVLQPGGLLLFRDYGLYDMTMLRFPLSQKISDRLYQRKDGTLSYFFTLEVVRQLFLNMGLIEEELHYCCVELMNRKKKLPMKRVWIHAKFRKPQV